MHLICYVLWLPLTWQFYSIGGERAVVIKISAPIKLHFAKTRGLDLQELMGQSEYKEIYRKEMIKWGEDIRNKDHGYFCRAAIELFEGIVIEL